MVPRGTAFTHRTSDMFASKDLFLTQSSGATGYQISRSVRLRSSASAYFNRTPASASNRTTWTWSGWVKRGIIPGSSAAGSGLFGAGTLGNNPNFRAYLFDAGLGSNAACIFLQETVQNVSNQLIWYSTPIYRDPSAWYHIVIAIDTTQATSTNRVKVYVNGVQQTGTFYTTPAQNQTTSINNTVAQYTGAAPNNSAALDYFDGYLTEINFIDGQQLTPSSFGATSTTTGVWGPTKYTGTYGTNGFYLNFSDNSAATAAAIGKDYSGNGNNWTPNNISVTAGATYDSMVDTPTPYGSDSGVGGEVRGNYAVINPIYWISGNTQPTINDGNLKRTNVGGEGADQETVIATMPFPTTGKWYFEFTFSAVAAVAPNRTQIGIQAQSQINASLGAGSGATKCFSYGADGQKVSNGSYAAYGNSYAANDVIGVAVDLDNGALYFSKNNTWQNSGVPTSGASKTGAAYTTLVGTDNYFASVGWYASGNFNFGQRPFAYTAPSGFKALCTQNLSTPTIANGAGYMAATLYTGTGASQTVSNAVNSISFQPDLVWIKSRSATTDNKLTDFVRGTTKALVSNSTAAETTDTNGLTAFNSNGFTVGTDTVYNNSGATYVGWNWKGGGTAVSNTSGSITSSVSANPTAGFSVVTYTGTGANATIGHGIGAAPSMVIIFERSPGGDDHIVYHSSLTSNQYAIRLNTTAAQTGAFGTYWNSTSPTSSVFSVGTSGENNQNTATYVAYCFAPIAGYSAFGSYTGNGSSDGPFVYTGFRPRWVLMKSSTLVTNWWIIDTARNTYNVANTLLTPSNNYADDSTYNVMDVTSNGFKIRTTYTGVNSSNDTYIYAAFAENSFKFSLAR